MGVHLKQVDDVEVEPLYTLDRIIQSYQGKSLHDLPEIIATNSQYFDFIFYFLDVASKVYAMQLFNIDPKDSDIFEMKIVFRNTTDIQKAFALFLQRGLKVLLEEFRAAELWPAKYTIGDDELMVSQNIITIIKFIDTVTSKYQKDVRKILKRINRAKVTEKQLLNDEQQRKEKANKSQTKKSTKSKVEISDEKDDSEDEKEHKDTENVDTVEVSSMTRTLQHVALEEIEKQNEQKARRFHALYMEALARGEYDISEGTSSEADNSCVVCLDNPADTKFLPCGQKLCCRKCAENIAGHEVFNKCPFCRKVVTGLE